MNYKLRILIIAGAAILAFALGTQYSSIPISDRAIILGIGIDYDDGAYETTCEIVVPGDTEGGPNTDRHKIITGSGDDIPHALQDVFKKTGKYPSLGHCGLIVLGERMSKLNIAERLSYFLKSDSFKDGALLAAAVGSAKALMNSKTPLDNFNSMSLQSSILIYGKKTDTMSSTLQKFNERALSNAHAGYITLIEAVEISGGTGGNADGGGTAGAAGDSADQRQVFYDCSRVCVYKDGGYAGTLSSEETHGLSLLDKKNNFSLYKVGEEGNGGASGDTGGARTLSLSGKRVAVRVALGDRPELIYEISLRIELAEAERINEGEDPPGGGQISEDMIEELKRLISADIQSAIDKSVALGCDYLNIANKFFAKYGDRFNGYVRAHNGYLENINYSVKINVNK